MQSDPSPIVIIDLKGAPELFNTVREESNERGQAFLFFTAELDKPSYYFNPFTALKRRAASLPQQTQQLLDGLGRNFGDDYARSYFTGIPRHHILSALKRFGTPTSFPHLHEMLVKSRPKGRRSHDTADLEYIVESFCFYPQLFTTAEQERTRPNGIISFDRVLEDRQVVYFWLPAAEESIAVRDIGKFVLFNYLSAAKERQDKRKEYRQAYLFVDEFQRLVGESLQIILEQARSYGIGVVLSNHSAAQLRTSSGKNLWPLIHGNTAATLHFGSVDRDELKMLSDLSGEVWRDSMRTSGATRSAGQSQSWRDFSEQASVSLSESRTEELGPHMKIHDLLNLFSEPQQFFLHVYRNVGLSCFNGLPIAVKGVHCSDLDTYQQRAAFVEWPEVDDGSGILLDPAARVDQLIPRAEMEAIIRNLFDDDQASRG